MYVCIATAPVHVGGAYLKDYTPQEHGDICELLFCSVINGRLEKKKKNIYIYIYNDLLLLFSSIYFETLMCQHSPVHVKRRVFCKWIAEKQRKQATGLIVFILRIIKYLKYIYIYIYIYIQLNVITISMKLLPIHFWSDVSVA